MSAESYAFMSAENKDEAGKLARRLDLMGIPIISMGGTADEVRAAGVQAISPKTFIGDPDLDRYIAKLPDERTRRHAYAARLGEHMSLAPQVLQNLGWGIINVVYVHMMAHDVRGDLPREYPGINNDRGGETMLRAGYEGGRDVLSRPSHIDGYLKMLDDGLDPAYRRLSLRRLVAVDLVQDINALSRLALTTLPPTQSQ